MGLRLNAAPAERQLQIFANSRLVSVFDLRGPMEPKAHGSPFFADLSLATCTDRTHSGQVCARHSGHFCR